MRVVISTIGRFHSINQGLQLQARGALTALFTGYPRFKLADSGIKPEKLHCWPWLQAPYMGLIGFPWFQRHMERRWARLAQDCHDRHVAAHLPDCDIVIALSGMGRHTGRTLQARGGRHVCDRGSSHIGFQDDILAEEYALHGLTWAGVDPVVKARELAEYDSADAIAVPSRFARDSFIARGVPADKLILAPYGGDLSRFRPLMDKEQDFRILFVGQLALRKGLSYLLQAVRRAAIPGATLVLAGSERPETAVLLAGQTGLRVEMRGILHGDDLVREMSRASVLVLPSIEDGFGMVMAEAMACGTPVIASAHTGAADLFTDGVEGFVVPIRDPDAIADRLALLADDPGRAGEMGQAARQRIDGFGSWHTYGETLYGALGRLMSGRSIQPDFPSA